MRASAALLAAVAAVAGGHGRHHAPRLASPQTRAVAAARVLWGRYPSCGVPVVRWAWPSRTTATDLEWVDLINGKPGDCFVNVNIAYFKGYDLAGVDYGLFCQVVAHGVGHLLGFGHSTDPTNLMFPDATPRNMPAECKVAP